MVHDRGEKNLGSTKVVKLGRLDRPNKTQLVTSCSVLRLSELHQGRGGFWRQLDRVTLLRSCRMFCNGGHVVQVLRLILNPKPHILWSQGDKKEASYPNLFRRLPCQEASGSG